MTVQLELKSLQRDWVDEGVSWFRSIGSGWRFTTDDLHPMLGEPAQKNWMGVLIAAMKEKGLIREVGRVTSKRPSANGRKVTLWEVV